MTEQHSQTDNPVASTPVPVIKTEEASPSRQTGGNGNTLLTVLVVLAVLLGGYSFYRTIFPSQNYKLTWLHCKANIFKYCLLFI